MTTTNKATTITLNTLWQVKNDLNWSTVDQTNEVINMAQLEDIASASSFNQANNVNLTWTTTHAGLNPHKMYIEDKNHTARIVRTFTFNMEV